MNVHQRIFCRAPPDARLSVRDQRTLLVVAVSVTG